MKAEGTNETPDTAPVQPKPAPEPAPAPAQPEKPQMGRVRRLWRSLLIGLAVVAVAFLAGLLACYLLRYKPLTVTLAQTQTELAQLNETIGDLQSEVESLNAKLQEANDKIARLEGEKQALQEELDTAKAHPELLRVLVDVSNARLALFLDDVEGAKTALAGTADRFSNLHDRIAAYDANLAQSMPQRLNLIINGLDTDPETARVDLELLTKNLLDVENALFSK
ncbi:MAG TPA: hypothetical protein EYP49_00680 [Anaerolineae bacterium]|nr:hypothetical protein [Anaerolineae bacterium]